MKVYFAFTGLCLLVYLHLPSAKCDWSRRRRSIKVTCCKVSLPQHTSSYCRLKRKDHTDRMKAFYKIAVSTEMPIPHIGQKLADTLSYFMTEKFHSHWFNVYFQVLSKNLKYSVGPAITLKYKNARFTAYENYTQVSKDFKDYVMRATYPLPYFKFPSKHYTYFTELTSPEAFQSDRYFVEQRLAGLNPMAIRRVDLSGEQGTKWSDLQNRLKITNFRWDMAVKEVTGVDITESISQHRVYVVEYPMLHGIKGMSDVLALERPSMKMRDPDSPIALFAVDSKRQLRPVAIQNGTVEGSKVFTPKDEIEWSIAKAQLQLSDGFVGQVYEHLLRTHLRMEPICIALYRHLSTYHPIFQIMKYHCRGTIPLNMQGKNTLLVQPQTVRSLFPYGNEGAKTLLWRGFQDMKWNDIDVEGNIRERGMDDVEQIPDFPYRDDGKLINKVLIDFSTKLVNKYYRNDDAVRLDTELQKLVNELSAEGREGPDGGNGKIRGLPSQFSTKKQLADFIKESLWIVVQHAVYSYPIAEHGSTATVFPTKLYQGNTAEFIDILPGPTSAVLQASLAYGLGSLHYDSFFDYGNDLKNSLLASLVKDAHKEMSKVRNIIHARNKERYSSGRLTNPFMLQDWMPNSISS